MKAVWTLARKDLRLLLRDPRAAVILLAMPFVFILVLGLSVGEGFGQKPDDRLRVSLVDLDRGYLPGQLRELGAWLSCTPGQPLPAAVIAAETLARASRMPAFPDRPWSKMVLQDLAQTAGIRIELIDDLEKAQQLIRDRKRSAVIIFGPDFSDRVARCSFLADGINPFFRDGVDLERLGARVEEDTTQLTAAGIIKQVAQGTLLRVVLPWMIGRAFEKIGEPEFVDRLSRDKIQVPVPGLPFKVELGGILSRMNPRDKQQLATGLQNALQGLFPNYNLTAKTWVSLTRADPHTRPGEDPTPYRDVDGTGLLRRGAFRYQLLVPSYTVMFAFFLVLTVGWLFVAERRQGTLKRLCVAPLTRTQIIAGKMLPCLLMSLLQGLFLLAAGKLVFDMSWGPEPLLLLPVVFCTSLAAMGLALLVAALSQTETQVSIYGTLLVLVLAGLSGCLMGDREMMPPAMQEISRITPHAWALDAYRELLANPGQPNCTIVRDACGVLTFFGIGFVALAWCTLKLEA